MDPGRGEKNKDFVSLVQLDGSASFCLVGGHRNWGVKRVGEVQQPPALAASASVQARSSEQRSLRFLLLERRLKDFDYRKDLSSRAQRYQR